MKALKIGDYVLACKYNDALPQEHSAVGFYAGTFTKDACAVPKTNDKWNNSIPNSSENDILYDVVDNEGVLFRNNGFRFIRKISIRRGELILGLHNTYFFVHHSKYTMKSLLNMSIKDLEGLVKHYNKYLKLPKNHRYYQK